MTAKKGWKAAVFSTLFLATAASVGVAQSAGLPPGEPGAKQRLLESPRH